MSKYFHELTKTDFEKLVEEKITWAELAKRYPRPKWCNYPDATQGIMGCWSLMDFQVTGENYCKKCECYSQ